LRLRDVYQRLVIRTIEVALTRMHPTEHLWMD
jgi:hypothetical protein